VVGVTTIMEREINGRKNGSIELHLRRRETIGSASWQRWVAAGLVTCRGSRGAGSMVRLHGGLGLRRVYECREAAGRVRLGAHGAATDRGSWHAGARGARLEKGQGVGAARGVTPGLGLLLARSAWAPVRVWAHGARHRSLGSAAGCGLRRVGEGASVGSG
jgi:hypothetical protein